MIDEEEEPPVDDDAVAEVGLIGIIVGCPCVIGELSISAIELLSLAADSFFNFRAFLEAFLAFSFLNSSLLPVDAVSNSL